MIYRIGRKKYQFYAFDIESHNDIESIKKMETSMWLGCFIDENSSIDDESSYLYNMNQFIDRIEYLSNRHRHSSDENRPIKNIAIYIYNLYQLKNNINGNKKYNHYFCCLWSSSSSWSRPRCLLLYETKEEHSIR